MKTEWTEHFCLDCGELMVIRQDKNGDKFMGCSAYPDCEYTEELADDYVSEPEE